jgi:hypothetical protein
MKLPPDIIELAQQIADALQERINALPELFYHSAYYTKEDCFKHLIEPLPGENQIDTLLKSLAPNAAKPLRERYDRLMSCFDTTGKPRKKNLLVTTVERYVKDIIKELRDIAQGSKQRTTAAKQKDKRNSKKKPKKTKPIKERFTFRPGQVLFDGDDLDVGTGAVLDIAKALIENFGHVVPFKQLDEYSPEKEASEKVRTAIVRLRKTINSAKIPVIIKTRKNIGYLMLESTK